jgi:hypothetical protein
MSTSPVSTISGPDFPAVTDARNVLTRLSYQALHTVCKALGERVCTRYEKSAALWNRL